MASLLIACAGCNSAPADATQPVQLGQADSSPHGDAAPPHGGADPHGAAPAHSSTAPAAGGVLDVSRDALRSDIYFLASDRLEGRGLGTAGLEVAADFITARFRSLGLKPVPGYPDFSQPFDVTTVESAQPGTKLTLGGTTWTLDKGIVPPVISADKSFAGPVVFAGYGIVSGQRNYDDYAGIDVKGKVVLAMRYEPKDPKTKKSRWSEQGWSGASSLESKAAAASQRGAVALLMVNPPNHPELPGDEDNLPAIKAQRVSPASIPVLYVKRNVAAEILKAGGLPSLMELQDRIDAEGRPGSRSPVNEVNVKGDVALKRTKKPVRNVMAMIPGQGPTADEYVIIGAHMDHLGYGGPGSLMTAPLLERIPGVTEPTNGGVNPHAPPKDPKENPHAPADPHAAPANPHASPATATTRNTIHHGADDNASGTAAMLELARIYSHRPAPARTLIFVSFTAEEAGLIGSAHFVKNPPVDLKKVSTMLNLDMVGRVRKNLLYVGGHGTGLGLEEIVKRADLDSPLEFKNIGRGGLGPSDHMSFATRKVPVLFFFSGTHVDYHKPSDTADKINYDGVIEVVRFSRQVIDDLTTMPMSAYVDAADRESMTSGMGETSGGRRVTLGVIPSYAGEEDGKGVKIDGTTAGTPAAKAGLQAGDLLLSVGGMPTTTLNELTAAIAARKPGDQVKVVFVRDGKQQTVDVTMAERK